MFSRVSNSPLLRVLRFGVSPRLRSAASSDYTLMRAFSSNKHDPEESADLDKHSSEARQYLDSRKEKFSRDAASYPAGWCNELSLADVHTRYSQQALESKESLASIVLKTGGRVESVRKSGSGLFFFDLESEGVKLQVICSFKTMHAEGSGISKEEWDKIDTNIRRGDILGVTGTPGLSKSGQFSLFGKTITLLAPCLHMLPLDRVGIKDVEVRFRQRYLDLMVNKGVREKFVMRQRIISFLRQYLDSKGFLEVETPVLSLLSGGANAKPFKTYHNDLKTELSMRVAPELYLKQLIIGGFEKVYEIGKNFRNEGIDYNHNPEFTACEFYWAYSDYNQVMELTEDLLLKMVHLVSGGQGKLKVKRRHQQEEVEVDFTGPFKRISIIEELERILKVEFPKDFGTEAANKFLDNLCTEHKVSCSSPRTTARLIDKLVGHFIEPGCINPTFLMDHPQIMSPLARPHRSKPGLTERFELFINEFEVVNSYSELNNPFIQRQTFEAQSSDRNNGDDEAQPFDEDFVKALEHGLPPTGGFGIGIDRLVMLLTNSESIQEVLLFPAMRPLASATQNTHK